MKKAMQLLIAIGQIQDNDILDAHNSVDVQKKMHRRIVLIAAIVAVLILLAGCATFAWHWYATYFTNKRQEPLSSEQIEYINENAEDHQISQLQGGFTIELESVISGSNMAYVTFGLTAPEKIDFSDVLDIHSDASLGLPGLQAIPSGSDVPANISYDVIDDGDEKNNTLKIVIRIDPGVQQGADSAFGPGKTCEIVFKDIVKWGHDQEYEQELLATKYAGQTDYMLTPEESERVHPRTLLASGEWKFVIELTEADSGEIELLESPVSTKVWVVRNGATEFEAIDSVEDVTLTSVRITPLSVEISFDIPEPSDKFSCIHIDAATFPPLPGTPAMDYENVTLVMKDGTEISLFQSMGAKDVAILAADSPIVLEKVDYLQMSDGTKLHAK